MNKEVPFNIVSSAANMKHLQLVTAVTPRNSRWACKILLCYFLLWEYRNERTVYKFELSYKPNSEGGAYRSITCNMFLQVIS